MKQPEIRFREIVTNQDIEFVREIVNSTGFFHDYEINIAVELVEETIIKGSEEGYRFVFADYKDKPIGYCCYGLIPCTKSSYDLYWIAVHNNYRGKGIGKALLNKTELAIKKLGGTAIFIETSSKELYKPTRQFYLNTGYVTEVVIKDFYDAGDDKYLFSKRINEL